MIPYFYAPPLHEVIHPLVTQTVPITQIITSPFNNNNSNNSDTTAIYIQIQLKVVIAVLTIPVVVIATVTATMTTIGVLIAAIPGVAQAPAVLPAFTATGAPGAHVAVTGCHREA